MSMYDDMIICEVGVGFNRAMNNIRQIEMDCNSL